MLLTLLLIAIAMVVALGTALYLAYVETEADFPTRHEPHHVVRARWRCKTPSRTRLAILGTDHSSVRLDARGLAHALNSHETSSPLAAFALPRVPGS
jgi:hypothetical protein